MTKIHRILEITILTICFLSLVSCRQDISLNTNVKEVVVPERVVVEHIIQPMKTESLDVLAVLDTSCSMSDNYDELSAGLEILKGEEESWINFIIKLKTCQKKI